MDVAVAGQKVRSIQRSDVEGVYPRDHQGRAFAARAVPFTTCGKRRASPRAESNRPQENQHFPPARRSDRKAMFRSAIWAAGQTTRYSSSIWACLRPTSVRPATTACITRRSMTSPGSRSSAILTLSTSSRWPACSVSKWCAWPSADVLPYDYEDYAKEILVYLEAATAKSKDRFGDKAPDFSAAVEAARRLQEMGAKMQQKQRKFQGAPDRLNAKLRDAERGLLIPEGLPNRPWFHHAIYAPGQYTGYAAVVIPGVNEAIDRGDLHRTEQQIGVLAAALNRASKALE